MELSKNKSEWARNKKIIFKKWQDFEKKAEISKKNSKEAKNKQKIFQKCEKLRKESENKLE